MTDGKGILEAGSDRKIYVIVEGAGVLQGPGSANPRTEEGFTQDTHDTFFRRAQVIIRGGTETGRVKVTVSADGLESKEVMLRVYENSHAIMKKNTELTKRLSSYASRTLIPSGPQI